MQRSLSILALVAMLLPAFRVSAASAAMVMDGDCCGQPDELGLGSTISAPCCCSIGERPVGDAPEVPPAVSQPEPETIPSSIIVGSSPAIRALVQRDHLAPSKARAPPPRTLFSQRTSILR